MSRSLSPARLLRYWHTLRYLRPVQFTGRLQHRLHHPRPDLRPAPSLRPRSGTWVKPAEREPSVLAPSRFSFLNETHDLPGPGDWDRPELSRLWRYNLHYFEDLCARDAASRREWHRALISRWIRENPPAAGSGWEPYPTSLRISNWIRWALGGESLPPEAVESLAVQARWLEQRLEYHLLGNHLFENARALVFAGAFFAGAEADRWLHRGLEILRREIPEQVLPDGGHFERSPMYHALILEDMLDFRNLARPYPDLLAKEDALWSSRLPAMLRWLRVMAHPDGEIALFNDAAHGIASSPSAVEAYARRLGLEAPPDPADGITPLCESGYVRLQRGPAVLLMDVGPVGPDYLPGHAHADTLSLELSLDGRRFLVNGGTSTYAAGPERERQRSTAAHNTVEIDGLSSSEVWGAFRVARRARPFDVDCRTLEDGVLQVSAAHDGYRRLPGAPVHRRVVRLAASTLEVRDTIDGRMSEAVARFRLAPGISAVGQGRKVLLQAAGMGEAVVCEAEYSDPKLEPDSYHPRFGTDLPCSCIVSRFITREVIHRVFW